MTTFEFYILGAVVSFFATLWATYHAYGKVTVEDILLCLFSCPFSWVTAVLLPLLIVADDMKFMDKVLFSKDKTKKK